MPVFYTYFHVCRAKNSVGNRTHQFHVIELRKPIGRTPKMSVRCTISRSFFAAGIAVSAIAAPLLTASYTPAAAQAVSISAEFRTALEPYGSWEHSRRWGEVWIPARVARDWRPYTVGHWVFSDDYGWYWVSDDEEAGWGVVTFHYGRWVDDDELGWAWVPGNTWGPGWVQWRRGRSHVVGGAPLPPDDVVVEYRERPQVWIFVRERDLIAPRVTQVILPPQEREVFFRETVVVNRTVVFEDRRFAVNPGISPTFVAAEVGRPISRFEVRPHVLAGTAALAGAIVVRAEDIRNRERVREITRESTFVRETSNTIQPARNVPPPQPLAPNERGRLGDVPLRAAQGAGQTGQNRPGGPNAPQGGPNANIGQPNVPSTQEQRQGAVPGQQRQGAPLGQPLQQQERENRPGAPGTTGAAPGVPPTGAPGDRRTVQPGRDQRNPREGRPGTPPGAPPATSGAAPNAQPNAPGEPRGARPEQRGPREGRPGTPGAPPATSSAAPNAQPNAPGEPRGARPEQRGLREGRPGTPGAPPATSGAAPNAQPNAPGEPRGARPEQRGLREGRPETRGGPPSSSGQPSRPPQAGAE